MESLDPAELYLNSIRTNPGHPPYGCGWIHYPANSDQDYGYNIDQSVPSYCDNFVEFIASDFDSSYVSEIGCNVWNCQDDDTRDRSFSEYWLQNLPSHSGNLSDGTSLDWVASVIDPNVATNMRAGTINVPVSIFSTSDGNTLFPEVVANNDVEIKTGDVLQPGIYESQLGTLDISSPLKVVVFEDKNGNGIKEIGEKEVEETKLQLLEQKQQYTKELKAGWNTLSINILKNQNSFFKASDIYANAKGDGVEIQSIKKWNGKWLEYTVSESTVYGEDFDIQPNQGYFVYARNSGDLKVTGSPLDQAYPMQINSGWNLVGVSGGGEEGSIYTQSEFDDGIEAFKFIEVVNNVLGEGAVDNVTRWDSGVYRGVNHQKGKKFGIDFTLNSNEAYFVRSEKKGIFVP